MSIFKPNVSTVNSFQFAAEASNWNGIKLPVVVYKKRYWFVKEFDRSGAKRELLVYELAKDFCNVPKVLRVKKRILNELYRLGVTEPNPHKVVMLVQVAQMLDKKSLPNKTLDRATAAELTMSLWVRRRDVDIWNRSHLADGTPIFYDLSACLDFETDLKDIKIFFGYNRYGYGGSWRVKVKKGSGALSAGRLRDKNDHNNYIDSKRGFLEGIDRCTSIIDKKNINNFALYKKAGYTKEEALSMKKFLSDTKSSLRSDCEIMKEIVFSSKLPDTERRE